MRLPDRQKRPDLYPPGLCLPRHPLPPGPELLLGLPGPEATPPHLVALRGIHTGCLTESDPLANLSPWAIHTGSMPGGGDESVKGAAHCCNLCRAAQVHPPPTVPYQPSVTLRPPFHHCRRLAYTVLATFTGSVTL